MNNIQRKFLVSADIERWIEKYTPTVDKTEKFYVPSSLDTECYYHKHFPESYTKVVIDEKGNEESVSVLVTEYDSRREDHQGRVLVKKSYTVAIGDDTFVVEKYLKSLKDMYILTGYFQDEKAVRNSKIIHMLQPFILKEIDQDEKYHDTALALYSKPMEYNLHKFFEKIDAFESPNLFFWQVPPRIYVYDGVCLVLYRNIRLLNHYKMNFQKQHFASTLHRLRVLLHRTATMLEIFPELFNPNVQRFCIELLDRYYDETKVLRYLYFLDELCATREDAKLTLYTELKSLISQEERSVTEMLLSKPFLQMTTMLTREIKVQENKKYVSLKKEVKSVLKERLASFEAFLAKTKEGYDDAMLEELYASIDSLQTLIEDFFHIVGEKEAHLIIEELNILLKPLREYRNCKERASILSKIKAQSQTKTLETDTLLCEHEKALADKIENALKLLRTSKFYV
jgi:hypothetical protein